MFRSFRHWRRQRCLQHARIPDNTWQAVLKWPSLTDLDPVALERLRELASLFLLEKALEPAGGLELTPGMGPLIAAQACLPILNLGLDYYRGWHSIILYPAGFLSRHEYTDPLGLVHRVHRPLSGEAWERGPVILSWDDILEAAARPGPNVIIHEMAHKLDMLNGVVNGLPPLHRHMSILAWSESFNAAYQQLCQDVDWDRATVLDPYAAESPGEFFAVISEAFFETPKAVHATYPAVYQQLQAFYRQDPLARQFRTASHPVADAPGSVDSTAANTLQAVSTTL